MRSVITFLSLCWVLQAYSAYYDTLPQGRFNLLYRKIQTNSISNSFDQTGNLVSNDINFNLTANSLTGSNEVLDNYFDQLKEANEEAYNLLEIGTYLISPKAEIDVQVFGLGYGLSKTTTIYFGVPFYEAVVGIDFKRTKGNNYSEISSRLDENDQATLVSITNGLPDITEGVIQTVLVDHYGVKPIGKWVASGMGDIEVGFMQQIFSSNEFGSLIKFGSVIPTGKIENPDILQDISFGDGQLDLFMEAGVGFSSPFLDEINFSGRYTYQIASQKTYRIPDLEGISLGTRSAQFTEKLGDKIDLMANVKKDVNSIFYTQLSLFFNYQGQTVLTGESSDLLNKLPSFQETYASNLELKLGLSTVENYLKNGEYLFPFDLNFTYLSYLSGVNTQAINRAQVELNLYF